MPGYHTLSSSDSERLLRNSLVQTVAHDEFNQIVTASKTAILGTIDNSIETLSYYHVPNSNLTVITTPLRAFEYGEMLTHLNTFFKQKEGIAVPRQFLVSLIGHGATEEHIVTAYSSADRQTVKIFDPKVSDAVKFFAKDRDNSLWTLLRSLWRALKPAPDQEIIIPDKTNGSSFRADYISLGTQSFFDPFSCGYHSAATLKIYESELQRGEITTRESILAQIGNPVSRYYDVINNSPSSYKVQVGYVDFFKKALYDTFMPLLNEQQRQQAHFGHYFMGWPQEKGVGKKILYFVTLGFIVHPLANIIRRPLEFLPNLISEAANYFKHRLINWAPTSPFAQYFRSGLLLCTYALQGFFKGIYIALRTITSPVTSFQAAQQIKNPILRTVVSGLSILTSIAAYISLAIFAFPALAPLAGPAIEPIINVLAIPFLNLLAWMGFTAPPAAAAFLTVATGSTLLALTENVGNKLLSQEKAQTEADQMVVVLSSEGSNVASSLAKHAKEVRADDSLGHDSLHMPSLFQKQQTKSSLDSGFVIVEGEEEVDDEVSGDDVGDEPVITTKLGTKAN